MGRHAPLRLSHVLGWLGWLGWLGGCAQIAGIDETTGPVTPDRVSLTVEEILVGATIVREPFDLTGLTAQYAVADDAEPDGLKRVDAELTTPDTWSADIPEGTPPVFFDLKDPVRHEIDFAQRNVYYLNGRMQHLHPVAAPMGATLSVQATLPAAYAANESLQLYTLGSWNVRGFSAAEVPMLGATAFGPVMFPFSSVTSITGRPLEKLTTADAVLLLRYVGNKLTGVMEAAPFDQTGTDTVMGTMTAVAADQTLTITVGPPAAVAARYAPARPAMPTLSMAWYLHAAPGHEIANDNGPLLHAQGISMVDSGMVSAAYGNPFVAKGWPTVLTWSTQASRSYTPMGQTLSITLTAVLNQVVEPTPNLTLDLPAGLPEVVTIDGRPLSSDGLLMPKPTKAVKVTFVSGITNNTLYQLQLLEIIPNAAGTALGQKVILAAVGLKPEFTIPPEFLVAGHTYNFRAICNQGGFPGAARGDLRVRELPVASAYLDGGVFTVTP